MRGAIIVLMYTMNAPCRRSRETATINYFLQMCMDRRIANEKPDEESDYLDTEYTHYKGIHNQNILIDGACKKRGKSR